ARGLAWTFDPACSAIGSSPSRIERNRLARDLDGALERHPEPLQERGRARIVRRDDRDYPHDAEPFPRVREESIGRLERVAPAPMGWLQREADVHVLERVAPDKTREADRDVAILADDEHEADAVTRIHGERSIPQVVARGVDGANALVADVA